MKLPELVLLSIIAVVLGLVLCAIYFPVLAIAKLVRAAFAPDDRAKPWPPMRVRRWE